LNPQFKSIEYSDKELPTDTKSNNKSITRPSSGRWLLYWFQLFSDVTESIKSGIIDLKPTEFNDKKRYLGVFVTGGSIQGQRSDEG